MICLAQGVAVLVVAVSAPAAAAPDPAQVQPPVFKAGDDWIYDITVESGQTGFSQTRSDFRIERVDGDTILVGVKQAGAPTSYEDYLVGADWSRRILVDGAEKVTSRPLKFPMAVGETWTVDYTDPVRRGNELSGHVRRTYTVAGWTDVTTPAGTFHALKVVARGVTDAAVETPAAVAAGTMATPEGALSVAQAQKGGIARVTEMSYAELYYAPALRNFVRTIEERYTPDNVRKIRETRVLTSYAPAS